MLNPGILFDLAATAISRNKMRSALTALGIVIGVACVVAMLAIGRGASRSIQEQINSLGSNLILILPGATTQGGIRIFTGESYLTLEDAAALRAECPSVAYVSPGVRSGAQVIAGENNWGTSIQGVGIEWPLVRAWKTRAGSFFADSDARAGTNVCILGATVAENLFPGGDAVGQMVRIKMIPFKVTGVLEKKGSTMMGDQDDLVVVPYSTAMKRLNGKTKLDVIYASALSLDSVQDAEEEITLLLRQRHRLAIGRDSDFTLRSQQEFAQASEQSSRSLSILLGSAAAISLLVGGIGIMNIMLVSVTERTHEIGLRRAVGARKAQVLIQFLIEAIALAAVGGAAGVALGVGAAKIVARKGGLPVQVDLPAILIALTVSTATGVVSGIYPARKASRLMPIEALRHE